SVYESYIVIVTFPGATPVTIPFELTVAISSSLDVYVNVSVLALDGVNFNFICKSFPTLIVLLVVVNDIDLIGVITLISAVASNPSYLAFIVAFPSDTASNSLSSFISTTSSLDDSNSTPSVIISPSLETVIVEVSFL